LGRSARHRASLLKLGGIGPAEAAAARRAAHLGNLNRKAQDAEALAVYWKQLPNDIRMDAAVAATAARYHLALGGNAEAQAIVEQALEREWNPSLVALYGDSAGTDALPQIERAEKWLRGHARDPALLLALGKLCMRQGLWGKAQSYIEASLALEPTHDGHMTLAALMEKIGKPQEAEQHFRRSAELAGKASTSRRRIRMREYSALKLRCCRRAPRGRAAAARARHARRSRVRGDDRPARGPGRHHAPDESMHDAHAHDAAAARAAALRARAGGSSRA
jgi:tetratricopeptide (TPR) repeat protein